MEMILSRATYRLRKIPANTVVHTPTEAEARWLLAILHENGYKWCNTVFLTEISDSECNPLCICLNLPNISLGRKECFIAKCYTILTLAEFKERYLIPSNSGKLESQPAKKEPQPKFKVGDKVKINAPINEFLYRYNDAITCLLGQGMRADGVEGWYTELSSAYVFKEDWLEPYTEPDTKDDTKDDTMEMDETKEPVVKENLTTETKDYPPYLDRPKTVVETPKKELNLCELLKGHEGITLYSPLEGEVQFEGIRSECNYAIKPVVTNEGSFCANGKWQDKTNAVCCLFPSRALYEQYPLDPYAAWMKWKEEQLKCKMYLMIEDECNENLYADSFIFRTLADRDKCIEVIDAFLSKIKQSKSVASLCEEIKAIIEKYSKQ